MADELSGAALGWLACYLCLGLGMLAVQVFLRARLRRGHPPARDLAPHEIAYLHGRGSRAVAVSMAALRLDHAIDALDDGRLLASRPGADRPRVADAPLDEAVFEAIAEERAGTIDDLEDDPAVAAELDRLDAALAAQGLLTDRGGRRPLRAVQVALLVWAGSGLKIFVEEEIISGFPAVLAPWVGIGGIGLAGLALGGGGRRTREGRRAAERLRTSNARLDPRDAPAYEGFAAAEYLLCTALYGAPALLASDPDFARTAELDRYLGLNEEAAASGEDTGAGRARVAAGASEDGDGGAGGGDTG